VNAEGDALAADVAVPVPLHRERQRDRGHNQAALLAKPLAKKLRLPYKAVLLMRTRARPDKQVLSLEERWSPFVALLPHVQAAKLTIHASY
jgi:predicted amidophosphoribosyltransferase